MRSYVALLSLCVLPAEVPAFYVSSSKRQKTKVSLSSPNFPTPSFYMPYETTSYPNGLPTQTIANGEAALNGLVSTAYPSQAVELVSPPAPEMREATVLDISRNVDSGLTLLEKPGRLRRSNVPSVRESEKPVTVQGGSLRTWSFQSNRFERVEVLMGTEGRPLNANVEVWHGPGNTLFKMQVYVENGASHPFSTVLETPRDGYTVAITNTGYLEYPLSAIVKPDSGRPATQRFMGNKETIQGGAQNTYSFSSKVTSVQVLLTTHGRPLNCRIELLQGPNHDKQIVEVYTENGMELPFYLLVPTPGYGSVIRIVNTATLEFPLEVSVQPHSMQD